LINTILVGILIGATIALIAELWFDNKRVRGFLKAALFIRNKDRQVVMLHSEFIQKLIHDEIIAKHMQSKEFKDEEEYKKLYANINKLIDEIIIGEQILFPALVKVGLIDKNSIKVQEREVLFNADKTDEKK
jgi:hypothetical protein